MNIIGDKLLQFAGGQTGFIVGVLGLTLLFVAYKLIRASKQGIEEVKESIPSIIIGLVIGFSVVAIATTSTAGF